MRIWGISKRNLKEIYRDPVLVAFLLGMPIAFMLVFCAAFGGQHVNPTSISIADEDQSLTSSAFIDCIENVPAFKLNEIYTEESQARNDIENGKIPFYLLIPAGFEEANQAQKPISLELAYKKADPMIGQLVKPMVEAATLMFLGISPPINIDLKGTEVEIKNETINFLIPGVIVFGLMVLIFTAASRIAADREDGFLARMLTTPARPWDFILGYSLPLILVLIVSTLIYLGIGITMGLSIIGNIGLAFLIFFLTGLCSIGIGMIVGTLVKSESQSAISWVIIVPLSMISGALMSADGMPTGLKNFANALPFMHAVDASRNVISGCATFSTVLPDLYYLIGWTVVLFTAGIILFRRRMAS